MLPFSHPSQRSKYRSARSVKPPISQNGGNGVVGGVGGQVASVLAGPGGGKWTASKVRFFILALLAVASLTVVPIMLLEGTMNGPGRLNNHNHRNPKHMLDLSNALQQKAVKKNGKQRSLVNQDAAAKRDRTAIKENSVNQGGRNDDKEKLDMMQQQNIDPEEELEIEQEENEEPDLDIDNNDEEPPSPLGRGVNRLPSSQTPALVGAERGHIQCDAPVDEERIVYWSAPQGDRDQAFESPFAPKEPGDYYITFQPDRGGWNNIRMSMEILFVMSAATGRTLVLPPKLPLYLLGHGKEGARGFGDFFPLHNPELLKKVNIISMKEFIQKESPKWLGLTDDDRKQLAHISELCVHKEDSDISCEILHKQLRARGYQPKIKPTENCYIFDERVLETGDAKDLSDQFHIEVDQFCGSHRKPVFYDKHIQSTPWIHWDAGCDSVGQKDTEHCFRLLQHFYTFMYFTDPKIDNYYKRFVRDFLHYNDAVYCAASKVIAAVQKDADALNVPWSTWHVRRGDLQYKKVKIPAEEWYENTKEVWRPGELLYIATDERNKAFFDPVKAKNHPIKFLDDYWDIADLGKLDKTYIGMVDTIVASHGRAFAGTWFSTFTGYINRLRGYLGKSMKNSWYSFLPRKDAMQEVVFPEGNYPAREWHLGWLGIDSDEHITVEGKPEPDIHEKAKLRLPTPLKEAPPKEQAQADNNKKNNKKKKPNKQEKVEVKIRDMAEDDDFREKPVSRLLAGREESETPAVKGAQRGHIECDVNVDSLAYWNDPQGERDQNFKSPFAVQDDTKYITFSPDRGGWNNIRMCMETIFVIAAATGRTLVLPPKAPLYLLQKDKKSRHRGFGDFFPLETAEFQKRLKVITMEEFIKREGGADGRIPVPADKAKAVNAAAAQCDKRGKDVALCQPLFDYLQEAGTVPQIRAKDSCVVFDVDAFAGKDMTFENKETVKRRCGERVVTYWNKELQDPVLVHFRASEKEFRLLSHFYGIIYFTDPAIDHYYKRFVRDFLHYHDSIYCAAGKIVKALQVEGFRRGFHTDEEGGGGYSALHVRRGDLQYKKVKIPAEEWYQNTKEVWKQGEILYIATDERNKTFFDPIKEHHDLRFLDDYFEMAGLKDLDPNYMGMIDTIVASRGRAFAGTWFSTFSGYINRMRGYHGMSMMDSWYSFKDRKESVHKWEEVDHFAYAFEWPDAWIGIDADVWPSRDKF